MFNAGANGERKMTTGRFLAIAKPSPAEGVGRALQIAFRDGLELPADLRSYIDRLDRFAF
jgi:hypothetical protein